jgi:hypothetical protein
MLERPRKPQQLEAATPPRYTPQDRLLQQWFIERGMLSFDELYIMYDGSQAVLDYRPSVSMSSGHVKKPFPVKLRIIV